MYLNPMHWIRDAECSVVSAAQAYPGPPPNVFQIRTSMHSQAVPTVRPHGLRFSSLCDTSKQLVTEEESHDLSTLFRRY